MYLGNGISNNERDNRDIFKSVWYTALYIYFVNYFQMIIIIIIMLSIILIIIIFCDAITPDNWSCLSK